MDQRTTEIVKEINEQRQQLADNIDDLEGHVRAAVDWRSYFAKKPWFAIGAALAGGFLLSGLFSWRSR